MSNKLKKALIVDGHNVIHTLEGYRELKKGGQEPAIEKLLLDMVNLAGAKDFDITLVFDGQGETSESEIGGIKVIYSGSNQSADQIIEELVFNAQGGLDITVCTSDYDQQKVIWRRGVSRMTPRELRSIITETANETMDSVSTSTRNRVGDRLPDSIRRKLEIMRRGKQESL